jgi:cytochrome P450
LRRSPAQDFSYHNAPEKTRAAHLEPGLFTYGDCGYLDEDGFLFLTGRADDTIVSGGVNVYPAEVESVLVTHPWVRDAAVFGVPDDEFGERAAATVELEPDLAVDLTQVQEVLDRFCRTQLASYKLPGSYEIVDALPREPTGKLRNEALRAGRDRPRLSDPKAYAHGVPHHEFARRRRLAPVSWVDESEPGSGYWAVTTHAALTAALRAPDIFSSAARGAFLKDREGGRQLLVNMDAPEHTRLRRYLSRAFSPRAVVRLRDSIHAHARAIVADLLRREQFDAVCDLAAELPLLVLTDLLGLPRQDRHLIFRWGNRLVGFDDPEYGGGAAAYREALLEMFAYALELASQRRRRHGDDLVSALLTAQLDGRRLTETEFCHLWILLVVAGNETTRHLLSGGLQTLVEWRAERDRLVADPQLIPTAVDELLRWITPIMQFRRTATRDTELAGQPIREGDKVVLYFISANRDDAVFASPDRLDLGRSPNPHVTFGVGPHYCLGAHLAREEAAIMLGELRPHLDRLVVTEPVVRLESNFMNGIKSITARFVPPRHHRR